MHFINIKFILEINLRDICISLAFISCNIIVLMCNLCRGMIGVTLVSYIEDIF